MLYICKYLNIFHMCFTGTGSIECLNVDFLSRALGIDTLLLK